MAQTDILGAQESSQSGIARASDVKSDFVVERTDGDFVELFAREADVLEVRWAGDLCITR
jgi:hypothetical protein